MEASHCAQDLSSHTASLLTGLNLQREQAQFCDCVVRQRQSPGQLYPAHRCVLAASSPVLASILSSAGVLVELQAPCLSGSVLALLLDYIYTGTLPYTHTQQCYYSLLTAAHYLQMDELQEALRAWQQAEVTDADKTNASTGTENEPCKDIVNTHSKTVNSCSKYLPLMCGTDVFRRCEENDTCSVQSDASSLERADHQYSVNAETCDEAQMHSARTDSCLKAGEMDLCGASDIHDANCCSRKDVSTLSNGSAGCSISENCREKTGSCRQVTYLTSRDLIQNIPCTAEVHGVSKVDKEVQKDQFHSPGTVKPETWQNSTEEELVRTVEDRRNSSSSSSPHPCCGAVPVIRHSSRTAMFQLAEVSTMPLYHPVSQASGNSSRAPVSLSASTDSDSIVEGITTKHKYYNEVQNQDYRNNKDHTGEQSWDYQNSTDQCAIQDCYKSSTDQSDMLEQDYNSSNEGNFMKQNDEHMDNGLSHITGHNGHRAHCDSFQSENHRKHDSVPQNNVCRNFIRRLKYKTDLSFDDNDLPSKHQRLDWSDCHIVSKSAAAEELSQHQRAGVSLPVEDSDMRSDSHCEHLNPDGDRKADWHPKLHEAETRTQDTASSRHGHDLDNKYTTMEDKSPSADVSLPNSTTPESSLDRVTGGVFAFERQTSLDLDKVPYTEIPQPHLTYTRPLDSNISDPIHSVVGQSYHGHLHYHCLPQEDTHLLHRDSNHEHSQSSPPVYSDHSSDEEEDGTFASSGHSSLRQHFVAGSTDQVLLLDISAKPAELLVFYKHRSKEEDDEEEEEEKGIAFCKNDIFGTGVNNEATSAAEVDKRTIRAQIKFGAESFDVDENKSSSGDTNVEERKSAHKDQIMPGANVTHEAGVVEEVSNSKEGDNQSSTLTDCSQGPVQASMSSTLSACMPSTLSASRPTDISAHLSTPLHHPLQCSLCDRSFSQRGSLNRHVRSHFGVRPFPCPCCPMTFSRQYRVTEHMRVHQRCTMGNDFHKPPAS